MMENSTNLIMYTAEDDEYLSDSVVKDYLTTASDKKNYGKRNN